MPRLQRGDAAKGEEYDRINRKKSIVFALYI
jgi:hypothetical protein